MLTIRPRQVDQPKENTFEDYLSFNDNARFNFSDVTETEVLYELEVICHADKLR